MNTYIYTYIHAYIHTSTYNIHICMHTVHTYLCTCIHTYLCTYVGAYIHVYMYIHPYTGTVLKALVSMYCCQCADAMCSYTYMITFNVYRATCTTYYHRTLLLLMLVMVAVQFHSKKSLVQLLEECTCFAWEVEWVLTSA